MTLFATLLLALAAAQAPTPVPAAAAPVPAPGAVSPVRVTATPSKSEVTIGETISVTLAARGPDGTRYTFPAEASSETLELHGVAEAAEAPSRPASRRYEATAFALGEALLPAISVGYVLADGTKGEVASEPVTLRVVSLLPKDKEQRKLVDVRGPLDVSIGPAFWVALAATLLLAAALGFWLVRRRRRGSAPVARPSPPVPPDAEALQALDALARDALPGAGGHRAFYIRLTAIAKRYLERRLCAPVLEMTTAETLAFLRGHPHGGELLSIVRDVAEAADRVKFARGEALLAEADRHLAAVRALVPALEARLRPPAPEAGGKAA